MEDVRLIVDIVIALGAATIGGLIAQRLGLPALIGYILAGLVIGPNTPGLVADLDRVQLLANLGVALLMFGLGVEFSLSEVIRVRRAALLGGAIQIPLTIVLGTAAGLVGGWTLGSALLLGGAFAISSSIVALKVLLGRGEMESPHARVALGLGIVQDFSLAPMLALIPVIAGQRGGGFGIAESLLISAVVLIAAFLLGTRLVPPLLRVVARSGSRELFMLAVVAIALGVALATHAVGLSLGLGAFLAGIVVSETDFEEQVLADIIPSPGYLRDAVLRRRRHVDRSVRADRAVAAGAGVRAGAGHREAAHHRWCTAGRGCRPPNVNAGRRLHGADGRVQLRPGQLGV